jgi:hypothetical protein
MNEEERLGCHYDKQKNELKQSYISMNLYMCDYVFNTNSGFSTMGAREFSFDLLTLCQSRFEVPTLVAPINVSSRYFQSTSVLTKNKECEYCWVVLGGISKYFELFLTGGSQIYLLLSLAGFYLSIILEYYR